MKAYMNSYDIVKAAIEKNNVRGIYNLIDGIYAGSRDFEYSDEATILFEAVRANGEGFVVDICDRILESIRNGRTLVLSDKQRWCVAFAAQKLSTKVIDALESENAKAIAEVTEAADNEEPINNDTNMNNDTNNGKQTTYEIQTVTSTEVTTLFKSQDEAAARAEFRRQQELLKDTEPADNAAWTDSDQAWSRVYHLELVRIVAVDEEYGDFDIKVLDETADYFFA